MPLTSDALPTRLAAIHAQLTDAHRRGVYLPADFYDASLTWTIDTLEAALRAFKTYGQHRSECHLLQQTMHSLEFCGDPCPLCTCGLEATMDTFTQRTEAEG